MGSLTGRPTTDKSEWKSHETLQCCFEKFQGLLDKGEFFGVREGNEYVLCTRSNEGRGSTICEAITKLTEAK